MVSLKPHELMYISCMYKKIYIAWAIFEILYFVVMNVILFDGTTERGASGSYISSSNTQNYSSGAHP